MYHIFLEISDEIEFNGDDAGGDTVESTFLFRMVS